LLSFFYINNKENTMLTNKIKGKKAAWLGGGVAIIGLLASCAGVADQSLQNGKLSDIKESIDSVPKKTLTLKGTFTQSLEQSEFNDGTTKYHVFDPNNLLAEYAKAQGQTGVSISLPVCIEGRVTEKGRYGHLGKYPYELWVDKICQS